MRTRPDITTNLDLRGGAVMLDEAGYLVDPAAWTREFASHAAAHEGIELGQAHWDVITFMRGYLDDRGVAADARFVLKFLSSTQGTDKLGAKHMLFELFPYGYVKQACKIAGMKQPRAWSTG
jgi:TusE/DsrC/DsvC family sulfur relay protein